FGERGQFQHDDLYAGTLRVPLVLRWPGRLPAGLRIGSRVRLIDVMPTILELLGVSAPPSLQGERLTALLHDAYGSPAAEGAVSEYSDGRLYESLRRGGLSYIVDGPEERLFDLVRHPARRADGGRSLGRAPGRHDRRAAPGRAGAPRRHPPGSQHEPERGLPHGAGRGRALAPPLADGGPGAREPALRRRRAAARRHRSHGAGRALHRARRRAARVLARPQPAGPPPRPQVAG